MREQRIRAKRLKSSAKDLIYIFVFCFIVLGLFKGVSDFIYNLNPIEKVKVESVKAVEYFSPTPQPTPTPRPTPGAKWLAFKMAAQKVCPMFNYPCNVVIAQGQLESGYGSSGFCIERNNCLGIGAVDWSPGNAFTFENMEQSIIKYMDVIRKNFPTAWKHRDNPDEMIKYIKYDPATDNMYATDPDYIQKVKSMPEWKR